MNLFRLRVLAGMLASGLWVSTAHSEPSSHSVRIAPWQGDMTAAYTLIIDDYGFPFFADVNLIEQSCDQYGIRVSFAMTTRRDLEKAVQNYDAINTGKRLIAKGHEIQPHSATHPTGYWDRGRIIFETDTSQADIQRLFPGTHPMVFLYPGGIQNRDAVTSYIRTSTFIGGRTLKGNGIGYNAADMSDPFEVFNRFFSSNLMDDGIIHLIDSIIELKGWGMLSFHNITEEEEVSNKDQWLAILEYLDKKRTEKQMWVAPVQEVMMYILERRFYTPQLEQRPDGALKVTLAVAAGKIAPSPKVPDSLFTVPLTLVIQPPRGFAVKSVTQDGEVLTYEMCNGAIVLDMNVQGGAVYIQPVASTGVGAGDARFGISKPVRSGNEHGDRELRMYTLDGSLLGRAVIDAVSGRMRMPSRVHRYPGMYIYKWAPAGKTGACMGTELHL